MSAMAVRHKHIAELQSFRGIAALVVMLHHSLYYFAMPAIYYPAVETIFNAHAAVVAFFVLSGYVLTLQLMQVPIGPPEITSYLVRRVFRIYPAILMACTLSITLLVLLNHNVAVPNSSNWASQFFRPSLFDPIRVVASFLGLGTFLVPPMWSITVELIGSVLVLVMAIMSRERPIRMAIFVVVLATASLVLPTDNHVGVISAYMVHFAFGASIPLWSPRLVPYVGLRTSRWLALVCLIMMAAFRLIGGWNLMEFFHAPLPALVEGAAAAVLIAVIATRREAFSLMASRPLVSLGDVSFSLYLLHFPVMAGLAIIGSRLLGHTIFASWPLSAASLMFMTALTSICLAYPSYRWIELSGIKFGNWLLESLLNRFNFGTNELTSIVSAAVADSNKTKI